jgi:hypothetical protein
MTSFDKKSHLIARDPLTTKLEELIAKYNRSDGNQKIFGEIAHCASEIMEKWNVGLVPWMDKEGKRIVSWGFDTIHWEYGLKRDGTIVMDAREINELISWRGKFAVNNPSETGLVRFRDHELPILIDLTSLTMNDARRVKREVWEIVKRELKKRKPGKDLSPADEPRELAFLYHCGDETFQNYLRWYDLKNEGLTFRLIALIEFGNKDLKRRDEVFERVLNLETEPIRRRVKGESTVRNGFNHIYLAIHRTPAPSKEKRIQTSRKYNCPKHGQNCFPLCNDYLEAWMREFETSYREPALQEKLGDKGDDCDKIMDQRALQDWRQNRD